MVVITNKDVSVDGTLNERGPRSRASGRTTRAKAAIQTAGGRNASADFRGERRANQTHRSTTDPDARLYRKRPGMA